MAKDQLAVVQRLAERHEKEAGARLSSAQAALASAENQLKQIFDYRHDYHRLATGDSGNLIDTHRLQAARHFLSELDKIARKQRSIIGQAELALEQQQMSWVDAKRRHMAIDKLRKQRRKEQQVADEKREQRELDDLFVARKLFENRTSIS